METIVKNVYRAKKKIKGWILTMLSFNLMISGFVGEEAKTWVRLLYNALWDGRYSVLQVMRAAKKGFVPQQLEQLGLAEETCEETISFKEYAFLRPINGVYSKWLGDIVSVHTIFKPYRHLMPACYYQIGKRDGTVQVIPLHDVDGGDAMQDVLALLRDKKQLTVCSSGWGRRWTLNYRDGAYYLDDEEIASKVLGDWLCTRKRTVVIMESVVPTKEFAGSRIRLTLFNEMGDNPKIGEAYVRFRKADTSAEETTGVNPEDGIALFYCIDKKTGKLSLAPSCADLPEVNPTTGEAIPSMVPHWVEICETMDSLCRFVPQLEFFGADIVITDRGFQINRLFSHPVYPSRVPFGKETSEYLRKKVEQKKSVYTARVKCRNAAKRIKLYIRAKFSRLFFPKAILPYISVRWIQDLWKDFCTNKDTTFLEKLWATRHGFISYRLHQYGITPENWKNYIADFEYKWLRHINNECRHWMEDKITVKYVCSEYNRFFPEYYYHISLKNGNNKILPMMDCPKGYTNTYEDIFRLVQEKGCLALKPDEGSHGDGFYKLSWENGKYYLNHQPTEKEAVLAILQDVNNRYLVTEYINMHPEIKRIYAGAVNTIRMIVFKKDGKNPVIGNAYMRFGSKRTGAVDNMGAGGMYAQIDVDTGRFHDAKIIEANEIKPCLYHPDTNEKIEGYLPNWEKVKQDVLDVARSIPQLEYFGFDLALTEDGLKFPEINRFPDYPAIEKYSPATIDYLLYKLRMKKKQFGYDVSRGHTLVKLPKR